MKGVTRGISLTLIGLIVAAIGVIAPILWDLWIKRSEITLTKKHAIALVKRESSIDKLSILYEGKPIDGLSKIVFSLANTGRTAITADDLVSPPQITFIKGEILQATISSSSPINLNAMLTNDGKKLAIYFPLFNSGDNIEFSVLISGAEPEYSVESRIKNINKLTLVDEENQLRLRSDPGIGVLIVSIFSLIFAAVFAALLREISVKIRVLKDLQEGKTPINHGEFINAVRSYIMSDLDFLASKSKQEILAKLTTKPGVLSAKDSVELKEFVRNQVLAEKPLGAAILVLAFVIAGIWYVVSSLIG